MKIEPTDLLETIQNLVGTITALATMVGKTDEVSADTAYCTASAAQAVADAYRRQQ